MSRDYALLAPFDPGQNVKPRHKSSPAPTEMQRVELSEVRILHAPAPRECAPRPPGRSQGISENGRETHPHPHVGQGYRLHDGLIAFSQWDLRQSLRCLDTSEPGVERGQGRDTGGSGSTPSANWSHEATPRPLCLKSRGLAAPTSPGGCGGQLLFRTR
jgi:hypothetical protein